MTAGTPLKTALQAMAAHIAAESCHGQVGVGRHRGSVWPCGRRNRAVSTGKADKRTNFIDKERSSLSWDKDERVRITS
jgi:hypothetical protein